MKDDQRLLKAMIGPFLIFPFIMWLVTALIMVFTTPYNGFDAGINQLSYPLTAFIMGEGLERMVFHFYDQYGKGCHYTAIFIYYGFFVVLSKHFRKLDIKNSLNVGFTTCFTALTIAVFEYFWMISYSLFQHQHWILGAVKPQTFIFIQNLCFILLGLLRMLNLNWKVVKLNLSKWTAFLLLCTVLLIGVWLNYGSWFAVQRITVETDEGLWTSALHFPQTVYTVARSPSSTTFLNTEAYWVFNDWVHLVNTLTKIVMTATFLNLFRLEYRELDENESE